MAEQIKGFNEAYKIAEKLGFKNYFVLKETTWEETHKNFKKGARILDRASMVTLQENVNMVLISGVVPVCEGCKEILSAQEYRSGHKKCENCAKDEVKG